MQATIFFVASLSCLAASLTDAAVVCTQNSCALEESYCFPGEEIRRDQFGCPVYEGCVCEPILQITSTTTTTPSSPTTASEPTTTGNVIPCNKMSCELVCPAGFEIKRDQSGCLITGDCNCQANLFNPPIPQFGEKDDSVQNDSPLATATTTTSAPTTTGNAFTCYDIICDINCPTGYEVKRDQSGCLTTLGCSCSLKLSPISHFGETDDFGQYDAPIETTTTFERVTTASEQETTASEPATTTIATTTAENKLCDQMKCQIYCIYGYKSRETCECNEAPSSDLITCPATNCLGECPNGSIKDSYGCETCFCSHPQPTAATNWN